MPERNTEEWIEAYLSDELSAEDRAAFSARLEADPELAQSLQASRHNMLLFQAADRHLEKEELRQLYMQQEAKTIPFRNIAFYATIAASVLFLLVYNFYPFGERQSYQEFAVAYYEPYPMTVSRSGEGAEFAQMATQAYQAGDYAGAIPLLEDWQAQNEGPDIPTFYLGHSYYQTKAFAMALSEWEQITDSSPYYEQTTWFRALAHLQMEQVEAAKEILAYIVDTGYHYQLEEAKALLEEI
ncbi:MAG: hypothetical protein AAFN10_16715 [Bacteroidota bacterium]